MATPALDPLSNSSFTPLTSHTFNLSRQSIDWAVDVCRHITDPDEQWFSFLNALAVSGVEQWLQESQVQAGNSRNYEVSAKTTTNLQVGTYRLYIAAMGTLLDNQITLPEAAINSTSLNHLYILVDVNEEASQVTLMGGLTHNQLQQSIQIQASVQENQGYILSTDQFAIPPERLLLYLNCLDASALVATETAMADTVSQLTESIATRVINTGKWLQNQLDDVAQQLAWELLPSVSLTPSFRQTETNISEIINDLAAQGMDIPQTARGAYTSLTLDNKPYRLTALTWQLMETNESEWSLFLLLGTSGTPLPERLTLQVSDEHQILSEKTISPGDATTYIYIQVIGTLGETFSGQVQLANNEQISLPQFGFNLT